jgi:hypothetical protein
LFTKELLTQTQLLAINKILSGPEVPTENGENNCCSQFMLLAIFEKHKNSNSSNDNNNACLHGFFIACFDFQNFKT